MEVTKKDVEKLIELRKNDTFINHLWNFISRDFRIKGEIKHSEIKVWNQNIWNVAFYSIFIFEFNENKYLINIKDKMNPVGKSIIGIAISYFVYLTLLKNLTGFNVTFNWLNLLLISIFAFLAVWLSRKIYKIERKNQIDEIFEILDVKIKRKEPEDEWSLKNILIRLFTYPFSFFVITICIWSLFTNGIKSTFMSLIGIGICGIYLYLDIKMIIKNKRAEQ